MPWSTFTPIYVGLAVTLLTTLAIFLWRRDSKLNALVVLLAYVAINAFFFLTVNWVLANYWLRFLSALLLIPILIRLFGFQRRVSFKRTPFLPEKAENGRRPGLTFTAILGVVILIAGFFDFRVIQSYDYSDYEGRPVLLQYPIHLGLYVAMNAGNGDLGLGMNNHYRNLLGQPVGDRSMIYAVDIAEISTGGSLAYGGLPEDRNQYIGINEPVYPPCPGQVVYVEDGHPDVNVLAEPSDKLGNRVVIQCFEYYVTVAGFRRNSIQVKVGEQMSFNRILGYLGNSGTPSIPHLHVHTTIGAWDETGIPVPMEFEYRFLVRNALYVR